MNLISPLKALFRIRPFSWVLLATKTVIQSERERVKKGSDDYIQQLRTRPWFNDDGDNTHRLNYNLDADSIVFDVGGYKGEYASAILNKYNCSIFVFEPVPEFYEIIRKKFSHNNKVQVFNFGLAASTSHQNISLLNNASSIYAKGDNMLNIELKSITDFLKENKIDKVDLVKINIEGAEYELLESLVRNKLITTFKNIQVQFHDFVIPDAKKRMERIQEDLAKTHRLTYSYEFVWENWILTEEPNTIKE